MVAEDKQVDLISRNGPLRGDMRDVGLSEGGGEWVIFEWKNKTLKCV